MFRAVNDVRIDDAIKHGTDALTALECINGSHFQCSMLSQVPSEADKQGTMAHQMKTRQELCNQLSQTLQNALAKLQNMDRGKQYANISNILPIEKHRFSNDDDMNDFRQRYAGFTFDIELVKRKTGWWSVFVSWFVAAVQVVAGVCCMITGVGSFIGSTLLNGGISDLINCIRGEFITKFGDWLKGKAREWAVAACGAVASCATKAMMGASNFIDGFKAGLKAQFVSTTAMSGTEVARQVFRTTMSQTVTPILTKGGADFCFGRAVEKAAESLRARLIATPHIKTTLVLAGSEGQNVALRATRHQRTSLLADVRKACISSVVREVSGSLVSAGIDAALVESKLQSMCDTLFDIFTSRLREAAAANGCFVSQNAIEDHDIKALGPAFAADGTAPTADLNDPPSPPRLCKSARVKRFLRRSHDFHFGCGLRNAAQWLCDVAKGKGSAIASEGIHGAASLATDLLTDALEYVIEDVANAFKNGGRSGGEIDDANPEFEHFDNGKEDDFGGAATDGNGGDSDGSPTRRADKNGGGGVEELLPPKCDGEDGLPLFYVDDGNGGKIPVDLFDLIPLSSSFVDPAAQNPTTALGGDTMININNNTLFNTSTVVSGPSVITGAAATFISAKSKALNGGGRVLGGMSNADALKLLKIAGHKTELYAKAGWAAESMLVNSANKALKGTHLEATWVHGDKAATKAIKASGLVDKASSVDMIVVNTKTGRIEQCVQLKSGESAPKKIMKKMYDGMTRVITAEHGGPMSKLTLPNGKTITAPTTDAAKAFVSKAPSTAANRAKLKACGKTVLKVAGKALFVVGLLASVAENGHKVWTGEKSVLGAGLQVAKDVTGVQLVQDIYTHFTSGSEQSVPAQAP